MTGAAFLLLALTLVVAAADDAGVIAFGVETEAQHEQVARLGVPWAQGWLYGRPQRP